MANESGGHASLAFSSRPGVVDYPYLITGQGPIIDGYFIQQTGKGGTITRAAYCDWGRIGKTQTTGLQIGTYAIGIQRQKSTVKSRNDVDPAPERQILVRRGQRITAIKGKTVERINRQLIGKTPAIRCALAQNMHRTIGSRPVGPQIQTQIRKA